jgi:outer membrane protein assembly factor BamD
MEAPGGGSGVGVEILNAPSSAAAASGGAAADPNALVKGVGPTNAVLPAAEKPADAPLQVNDIKPGENPAQPSNAAPGAKTKKPKADLSQDSSSKKKKKKGLDKLNPF